MKESPLILTLHAAVFGTFIWFALPCLPVLTAVLTIKPGRILRSRCRAADLIH